MNNSSYGLVPMVVLVLAAFGLIAALQTAIPDGPVQQPVQQACPL